MVDVVPVDVLRLIAAVYLPCRDRLRLAQTSRRWLSVARIDASPVVLGVDLREAPGFWRSPNGYVTCVPEANDGDPYRLGVLAATAPFAFIRQWVAVPMSRKDMGFKCDCLAATVTQTTAWHEDVKVAFHIVLTCRHVGCPGLCVRLLAANGYQLVRRAVWYGRDDVLCFLLDEGHIPADFNGGTALRLALGTLGYEHSEDRVAKLVYELLKRGADPLRHNLWGIRLCLQRNFFVVAALLCMYASKADAVHEGMLALVHELYTQGNLEHAFLVKTSMDEAPAFFCVD